MAGIGITGGVATGKSTVARRLFELLKPNLPIDLFNSDFEARRLTDSDFVVQEKIRSVLGVQLFDSDGNLVRDRLRELVFHDATARQILESILHPRIQKMCADRAQGDKLLLAEIPLLYETGAEPYFDRIIVTACGRTSQIERLVLGRCLAIEMAEKIIAAQMPTEEKICRADRVVWTDCLPEVIELQVKYIAQEVIEQYEGTNS